MLIENLLAAVVTIGWISLIIFTATSPIRYAIEDWVGKSFDKYKYLFGYAWQYDDGKKDLSFLKKKGLTIIPFEKFAKKYSIHYAYSKEDDAFEIVQDSGKGVNYFNGAEVKRLVFWPQGVKLESNQKTIKNLTGILISGQKRTSRDRFFKREQIFCLDYASAQNE